MRENLIADLKDLKISIPAANEQVYIAARELMVAKDELRIQEGKLIADKIIDGKNAEIRAAQMYGCTVVERQNVAEAEDFMEHSKLTLSNLQAELRINLALVELVKGDVYHNESN